MNVNKVCAFIVRTIFFVLGNYYSKFDYVKNYDLDTEKTRKTNRFIGYEAIVMGIAFLISIFLPSIVTTVCIFLLILYAIVGIL